MGTLPSAKPLMTYDTVALETPALLATSTWVGRFIGGSSVACSRTSQKYDAWVTTKTEVYLFFTCHLTRVNATNVEYHTFWDLSIEDFSKSAFRNVVRVSLSVRWYAYALCEAPLRSTPEWAEWACSADASPRATGCAPHRRPGRTRGSRPGHTCAYGDEALRSETIAQHPAAKRSGLEGRRRGAGVSYFLRSHGVQARLVIVMAKRLPSTKSSFG